MKTTVVVSAQSIRFIDSTISKAAGKLAKVSAYALNNSSVFEHRTIFGKVKRLVDYAKIENGFDLVMFCVNRSFLLNDDPRWVCKVIGRVRTYLDNQLKILTSGEFTSFEEISIAKEQCIVIHDRLIALLDSFGEGSVIVLDEQESYEFNLLVKFSKRSALMAEELIGNK